MLDRRYEEKMTRQERKQFEKEKLGQMTRKEKWEYFWMYDKVWLLVPLILIAALCLGITIYRNVTKDILLQVVVADADSGDYEDLESQFKSYIGEEGANQTVEFNGNLNMETYEGEIAFSALMGAEGVDVVICTERFYREEGEDVLEKYAEIPADSKYMEKLGISYQPVCACIVANAPNREHAEQFIEMLLAE